MKFKKYIKESLEDIVSKRCENCNTLLNDMGTCPKCDDGEEDHEDKDDEVLEEGSGNRGNNDFPKVIEDWLTSLIGNGFTKLTPNCVHYFTKQAMPEQIRALKKLYKQYQKESVYYEAENPAAVKLMQKLMDEVDNITNAASYCMTEELSNREKLKKAFPELNFDNSIEESVEEELTVREKLTRAYPELNFDSAPVVEEIVSEELSAKEKLKKAFPELNFDKEVVESIEEEDSYDYDDSYDFEDDDVEQDRLHAALYGGDRMYCDCGRKLVMDEWGGYCPECNPHDPESSYEESLTEAHKKSRQDMIKSILNDGTQVLLAPYMKDFKQLLAKYDTDVDALEELSDRQLSDVYNNTRKLIKKAIKKLPPENLNPMFFDEWGLGADIATDFDVQRHINKKLKK